jgi:hypothetical protein
MDIGVAGAVFLATVGLGLARRGRGREETAKEESIDPRMVQDAVDWAVLHGAVLRRKDGPGFVHVPFALFPREVSWVGR